MKRGTKVRVQFDGVVVSRPKSKDSSVRVSVRHPKVKRGWWAIVPEEVIEEGDSSLVDEAET